MTDLETQMACGKRANYASSDEDGETGHEIYDTGSNDGPRSSLNEGTATSSVPTFKTGPKGVIEDYRRYKELEQMEKKQLQKEKVEFVKKSALTCRTVIEDEEVADLEDDAFLREYHQKRLDELKLEAKKTIRTQSANFGTVLAIAGSEFVDSIDKEDPSVIIIIHIYETNIHSCIQLNKCLDCLAQQYPQIKFCKVLASQTGLSLRFKMNALPTLQVYKDKNLVGNFLRLGDEFDDDFCAADVENFLSENGALSSTSSSSIMKSSKNIKTSALSGDSSDDSDVGLN